jgi:hypothetical protein
MNEHEGITTPNTKGWRDPVILKARRVRDGPFSCPRPSEIGAHVQRKSNRMAYKSTLHTVPPLPGKSTFEYRFEVAAQALVAGT